MELGAKGGMVSIATDLFPVFIWTSVYPVVFSDCTQSSARTEVECHTCRTCPFPASWSGHAEINGTLNYCSFHISI